MTHKTLDGLLTAPDDDKAVWVQEKLDIYPESFPVHAELDTIKFIYSPDGIDAIERAMIGLGYCINSDYNTFTKEWNYNFYILFTGSLQECDSIHKNKSICITNAAIKTLWGK